MSAGHVDVLGIVGHTVEGLRFDACVGSGGFGVVYRGFHEALGETVAIKCLRIAALQETSEPLRAALTGRFRDETKLLYRLSQGSLDIVRCIGSGSLTAPSTSEYTPYMVLEWLDGWTLSADLRERRQQKLGGRSLEAAVSLLDSAANGIAHAHACDVVHRDIKPANLFLVRARERAGGSSSQVRMKVLDFGLAKILSDELLGVRASATTGVGVQFCSPSYGAPEQFSPTVGKIGPWTDVYALALVLCEVMLGEKARRATSLAEGRQKALDPATGSPRASSLGLHVPPAVEELLARALAQKPLERPHDVGVFWTALKAEMAAAPVAAAGPVAAVAVVAAAGPLAAAESVPAETVAAVQVAPAVPNLHAGGTVMDPRLDDAMKQVRAAQLQESAPKPMPFAGTMLMEMAPMPPAPPLPVPAVTANAQPGGPTTAPLAPPLLHGTMPVSTTSPLASSMAVDSPLARSPSARPPPSATPSVRPPPSAMPAVHAVPAAYAAHAAHALQAAHATAPMRGAHAMPAMHALPAAHAAPGTALPYFAQQPHVPAAPVKSSGRVLLAVVVTLVLVGMGLAFYWVRSRGP